MPTTERQVKVFKDVMKNGTSLRQAAIKAGYSNAVSNRPGKTLLKSKGWQELMDKYIPEKDLMKVHKEGLRAMRTIVVDKETVDVDDFATRHKYLETGYKIRGKLAEAEPDPAPVASINIVNILTKVYGTGPGALPNNS